MGLAIVEVSPSLIALAIAPGVDVRDLRLVPVEAQWQHRMELLVETPDAPDVPAGGQLPKAVIVVTQVEQHIHVLGCACKPYRDTDTACLELRVSLRPRVEVRT